MQTGEIKEEFAVANGKSGGMMRALRLAALACLLGLGSMQLQPAFGAQETSSKQPLLPTTDILIDAGHGGIDGGTTYGDLLEKQINLQIAETLYDMLRKQGISTALNRYGDYALSDDNRWLRVRSRHLRDLAQRKHMADQLQPKAMVSLHVNWSKHPGETGPLVLHQGSYNSVLLARLIQSSLNSTYRSHDAPHAGKTYYLLKHSPCPTVIVEMGFISNKSDRSRLTSEQGQQEIAAAIASALQQYLSITATTPDGVSYP